MKDFFIADDFIKFTPEFAAVNHLTAEQMAGRANLKLNKFKEDIDRKLEHFYLLHLPAIIDNKGKDIEKSELLKIFSILGEMFPEYTKECNHEPEIGHEQLVNALYSIKINGYSSKNITGAKCKYCGVKMKATWSAE